MPFFLLLVLNNHKNKPSSDTFLTFFRLIGRKGHIMPFNDSQKEQFKDLACKYEDTAKAVAKRYCREGSFEYKSLLCTLITHLWETYSKLPAELDVQEEVWIYSVLNHKALDLMRKEQSILSRIEYRETLPDVADEEDQVYINRLYKLIDMLDINDQEVLYMYLDDISLEEIGSALGGSRQRAIRRLRSIRQKLRELNDKTD